MDPTERDILARTIVGEASNQPFEGQQAVANVVLNRLNSGKYGRSISDVVFAPNQFEPWNTRAAELRNISPQSPAYQQANAAVDAALGSDVTGGATHFLQPDIVMQRRGGTLPGWAQGPSTKIGDHLFYAPDGKLAAGSTDVAGGPQYVAKATNPQPQNSGNLDTTESGTGQNGIAGVLAGLAPATPNGLTLKVNSAQPAPVAQQPAQDTFNDPAFQPRTFRLQQAANKMRSARS